MNKFLARIAGRCVSQSPTVAERAAASLLDAIGADWHCWRLSTAETDREFSTRLALHLQTIAIAVEDDLATILGEKQR